MRLESHEYKLVSVRRNFHGDSIVMIDARSCYLKFESPRTEGSGNL